MINTVTSEHQIKAHGSIFRSMLDDIAHWLPNMRMIHVFYTGPAALAFHFGRQISKTIHRHVTVYNYVAKDNPSYTWGLTITRPINVHNFFVQTSATQEAT